MKTATSVEFKDCDWKILDMPERVVFVRQQQEYLVLTQKQETFAFLGSVSLSEEYLWNIRDGLVFAQRK